MLYNDVFMLDKEVLFGNYKHNINYFSYQMFYKDTTFGQSSPPFPHMRQDDCIALEFCQVNLVNVDFDLWHSTCSLLLHILLLRFVIPPLDQLYCTTDNSY